VKGEWIMLDEVKLVYGKRELLGECVHDFIEEVGNYALERDFGSVYLYAHNGVGFDSFVVESFNTRYSVKKRLKTSRGILSMTLEFPYQDYSSTDSGTAKEKNLKLTFLDTKVFLSFSLAKICRDFSVPKEWQKLDFPITRLNWHNCYLPEVKAVTEPYAINDVMSLAFVVKQINRMVTFPNKEVIVSGMEEWVVEGKEEEEDQEEEEENGVMEEEEGGFYCNLRELKRRIRGINPANIYSFKPPVLQFVTFMSVVKKLLDKYFGKFKLCKPLSVDVPALRYWIEKSQMGGRTTAYAKVYASSVWRELVHAYLLDDRERVKELCVTAIDSGDCMVVLDVTSLYPAAMAQCPMPNGKMRNIENGDECARLVAEVGCSECERMMSLCDDHRLDKRGSEFSSGRAGEDGMSKICKRSFAVILVKGLKPTEESRGRLRHLCGRKPVVNGIIQYTVETKEEMEERLGVTISEVEAYTNVDLYWMFKQGFEVEEYLGGFVWDCHPAYTELVLACFERRKEAKKANNQCFQLTLKLLLNGMFGVHSQKVIREKELITTLPENVYDHHYTDPRIREHVAKKHIKSMDVRYALTGVDHLPTGQSIVCGKMREDLGESVGGYAPNHVGAAALAWSRHLVNLTLFGLDEGEYTYTDTDSLCAPEFVYRRVVDIGGLIDESGQTLGTYKNDHGELFPIGQTPRVLFSAIGTKKVKMHVVAGRDGTLHIANTFKGFLSMSVCPESGKKFSVEKVMYDQSRALLEILYHGVHSDRYGTRWNKSTGEGVRIERKVLLSADSETYLNCCKGFTKGERDGKGGFISLVVPHGSNYGDGELMIPKKVIEQGKVVGYEVPEGWEKLVKDGVGLSYDTMHAFLKLYYKNRNAFYNPEEGDEAYQEYQKINDLFDKLLI
jgi:hypothetical protein